MSRILVIGSLNIDFVLDIENYPRPGETILANDFKLVPGGKGANQAFACGKLGTNVCMVGMVGDDIYGKKLINNLKSANVITKYITKSKNSSTGKAFINVDCEGQNSIVVVAGANAQINKNIIDKNIKLIKTASIIVMQLEIPVEVVHYVAKLAKKFGKKVVLDPAPAKKNLPDELFELIDIIKPNETELEVLTGIKLNNDADIVMAAELLIKKGVKNVVVTLGDKGSVLVNKEGYKKFEVIKVDVVDTTGAGDGFTAGMVSALIDGKNLEDAIKYGHKVSSIIVTRSGAQTSIPTRTEVYELYKGEN